MARSKALHLVAGNGGDSRLPRLPNRASTVDIPDPGGPPPMASASAVLRPFSVTVPDEPNPPPRADALSRRISVADSLANGGHLASHHPAPPPPSPPSASTRAAWSNVSDARCASTPSPRRNSTSCGSSKDLIATPSTAPGRHREAQTATSSDHADTAWTCAACSSTDALNARAIRTATWIASLCAAFEDSSP